jgi:site-specific recombinase XerD
VSTARGYQTTLRLFLEFVTDGRYGWQSVCLQRFGQAPVQLLHEWNSIVHVSDFEGQPGRRPLTYDEIQALFDAADQRVDDIRAHKRKGALAAARDAAMLKTVYAFGLRRREVCGLDQADVRRNPTVPQFGQFGALFVRWGKGSKGSPPKRRTVLTIPEMDWIVEVLDHYLAEIRPQIASSSHPAVWINERCAHISVRRLDEIFEAVRSLAGLPAELDLHAIRHSYITHCTEFGYPPKFVQDQAGHVFPSTTASYTHVSDEFRNQLLREKLRNDHHDDLWGPHNDKEDGLSVEPTPDHG